MCIRWISVPLYCARYAICETPLQIGGSADPETCLPFCAVSAKVLVSQRECYLHPGGTLGTPKSETSAFVRIVPAAWPSYTRGYSPTRAFHTTSCCTKYPDTFHSSRNQLCTLCVNEIAHGLLFLSEMSARCSLCPICGSLRAHHHGTCHMHL
jgi:hypothetical protein